MRDIITLECTQCKNRNYSTTKNKKNKLVELNTKNIAAFAANILNTRKQNNTCVAQLVE